MRAYVQLKANVKGRLLTRQHFPLRRLDRDLMRDARAQRHNRRHGHRDQRADRNENDE